MKKMSIPKRFVGATATLLIGATLALTLPMTSCSYEAPDQLNDLLDEVIAPLGNYDYAKKPYFSVSLGGLTVYKDNAYYVDRGQLKSISLVDLQKNLKEYVRQDDNEYLGQTENFVCPVADHNHENGSEDCPVSTLIGDMFLLDPYESNGSFPIIYLSDITDRTAFDKLIASETGHIWEVDSTFSIYRYDTGANALEKIAETADYPLQMMSYGDRLYIVTQSAENKCQLVFIDKTSKAMSSIALGEGLINLISATDDLVYLNDAEGNIYRLAQNLESPELISSVEAYAVNSFDKSYGIFIEGDYLYYRANYETSSYPITETQYAEPVSYDIYRRPLADLQSEGELVAEDIFESCSFGVAGGKFYYSPMQYGEKEDKYYLNFTSGILRAVDLETLEVTDVVSDSGIMFEGIEDAVISEDYIISLLRPIAENGYDRSLSDGSKYQALYEFATGNLYALTDEIQ